LYVTQITLNYYTMLYCNLVHNHFTIVVNVINNSNAFFQGFGYLNYDAYAKYGKVFGYVHNIIT